jgi:hypothetical protein
MRKSLLIAAALAALPLPAAAQTSATPPAPMELNAEQRSALELAVARGRALAVLDQVFRTASADARSRIPAADAEAIAGWIAQPEGNGVTVTYYVRDGEHYAAIYRGSVLGGRVSSPQLFAGENRPRLEGVALRMAAARTAAEATDHQACGPDFNTFVLPPSGDEPVIVYRLSPRMAANRIPGGGHFRIIVAADGSIAEDVALAAACADLTIPPAVAGPRPRPLTVKAAGTPLPSELHVFLSLWAQRPLAVAAGADPVRVWGVTAEGIAELRQ